MGSRERILLKSAGRQLTKFVSASQVEKFLGEVSPILRPNARIAAQAAEAFISTFDKKEGGVEETVVDVVKDLNYLLEGRRRGDLNNDRIRRALFHDSFRLIRTAMRLP